MPTFSWEQINSKTSPWTRGMWLLQQLSEDEDISLCEVVHTAGHWGILLHERTLLCLFDNCPQTAHASPNTQKELFDNIKSKRNLNEVAEQAGDGAIFMLSTQNQKHNFSSFSFITNDKKTYCMALTNTGEMIWWHWLQLTERKVYKWKWLPTPPLTEGSNISIQKLLVNSSKNQIIWWEKDIENDNKPSEILLQKIGKQKRHSTHRICCQTFQFVNDSKTGKVSSIAVKKKLSEVIVAGFDDLKQLEVTNNGIWILNSEQIGFWTYGSQQSFTCLELAGETPSPLPTSLSKRLERIYQVYDVLSMSRHHDSDDILLVERSGRIVVCSCNSGIIAFHHLCTLRFGDSTREIGSFIARKHFVFAFSLEICSVFDLCSGVLLENINLPFDMQYTCSISNNGQGKAVGDVWFSKNSLGLWKAHNRLYMLNMSPMKKQMDLLSSHMKESEEKKKFPLNYLGRICKQWNLTNYHANYTLKELYEYTRNQTVSKATGDANIKPVEKLDNDAHYEPNDNIKSADAEAKLAEGVKLQQELAKELLPHSENPAMLLLLLTDKHHSRFLQCIVANFLTKYGIMGDGKVDLLSSYQHHTLLNSELIPQLDNYCRLGTDKEEIFFGIQNTKEVEHITPNASPADDGSGAYWLISGENLISAPRSIFELTLYRFPEESLKLLENFLHLSVLWEQFVGSQAPEQTFFVFPELLSKENPLLHISVEKRSTIAVNGERNAENPLFPTLCRLYLKLQPLLLIPFITLVYQSYKEYYNEAREEFFVSQAIAALPIFLHHYEEDTKLGPIQTTVQVALLCLGGMGQRAMHYLLGQRMWNQIFIVMRKYAQEEERITDSHFTPQSELFYILLSWCIKHKDAEHISLLWEFTPPDFGVLNLLRMIGDANSTPKDGSIDKAPPTIMADPKEELSLGIFKSQIIHMYKTANCSKYFAEAES